MPDPNGAYPPGCPGCLWAATFFDVARPHWTGLCVESEAEGKNRTVWFVAVCAMIGLPQATIDASCTKTVVRCLPSRKQEAKWWSFPYKQSNPVSAWMQGCTRCRWPSRRRSCPSCFNGCAKFAAVVSKQAMSWKEISGYKCGSKADSSATYRNLA